MENHGIVMDFSRPPKLRLRSEEGREFRLVWKGTNYPEEFCRLLNHSCQIRKGDSVSFTTRDDDPNSVVDVRFDELADVDPNQEETSTIVDTLTDSSGFAVRPCGCRIFVGRTEVVDEIGMMGNWWGFFQIGMVLVHKNRIRNGKVSADQIRIIS
jgi:hypothetical protein